MYRHYAYTVSPTFPEDKHAIVASACTSSSSELQTAGINANLRRGTDHAFSARHPQRLYAPRRRSSTTVDPKTAAAIAGDTRKV
jgi:hypothetical protein